jgi:rubrerythrin
LYATYQKRFRPLDQTRQRMKKFSDIAVDWRPFIVCNPGEKPPYPRSLNTREGLGDRLRFVAFAEKQATHAFQIASEIYDVPEPVKKIWRTLAKEEDKHLSWLIRRMTELNVVADERPQGLSLWQSFDRCETPMQFAIFMANAEDRGRNAGEQFYQTLLNHDPQTARLFQQIVKEEIEHIRLASAVMKHDFKIPEDFSYQIEGLPLDAYLQI